MSEPSPILVADDDRVTCDLLKEVLEKEGYSVRTVLSGEDAIEQGKESPIDLLICDIKMKGMDGLDVLRAFKEFSPDTSVILITGFGSLDTAIEAIKQGAYDYLSKPFNMDDLRLTVRRALDVKKLSGEASHLRQALKERYHIDRIIGRTPGMLEVYKLVAKVSQSSATVLIKGESGTGKELVARAIHYNSARAEGRFVPVDCSSLAEGLLESELFGHVKGAFTGAFTAKKGLFEEANLGTLFLDEVGDISPALQSKLLRVLQEHEFKRVGGTENIKVDVRIIAATNKELESLIKEGKFREDLYYRLNVVQIAIPPLRDRKDDIPLLVYHFLEKYNVLNSKELGGVSKEAMESLTKYSWPGNVRELENCIERAVILKRKGFIEPEDLTEQIRAERAAPAVLPLREMERRSIVQALEKAGWNKMKAAEILGIDRRTLYRMAERYGIPLKKNRAES